MSNINLPPYGDEFTREGAVLSTLHATPQPDPNMTIHVSPGSCWVNGKRFLGFSGANSNNFVAPLTGAKWSLLVLNYNGYLQIIDGTPSSDPSLPDCPRNCMPLCGVYLESGSTKITSENLFDLRSIINSSVYSHKDLDDITQQNQHPISAISNLLEELNDRPTTSNINDLLYTKADSSGTIDYIFKLNKDFVGTPSTSCLVEIERGLFPNVSIKWDEMNDSWKFTNDGSEFMKIQQDIFSTAERTGTGVSETIPHTLGRIPSTVIVVPTNVTDGIFIVLEGEHTNSDLILTVSLNKKYKILAY